MLTSRTMQLYGLSTKTGRILLMTILTVGIFLTGDVFGIEYFKGKAIRSENIDGKAIEFVEGEILVKLKSGYSKSSLAAVFDSSNSLIDKSLESHGVIRVEVLDKAHSIFEYIERLSARYEIAYAEPNYIVRLDYIPNDPDFGLQWDMHNVGQIPPEGTVDADIDAPEGWNITTGNDVVIIGILDTGIPIEFEELSHPELDRPDKVILGPDYVNGGLPIDDNGHGTHVAGTIAAEGDNGLGMAGIAWNCRIMPIKVFNYSGLASSYVILQGCIYAVDNGCQVINLSGGGSANSTLEYTIAYADSNDVVFCAAAGNSPQTGVIFPAGYSLMYNNLIAVSSSDHNDESSGFSSTGPEVTVAAPGGYGSGYVNDARDIYSTFPNYPVYLSTAYGFPLNYAYLPGTSMACPHVAGLAGLIRSIDPLLAADSVKNIIMNTADDLGNAGFDEEFGHGRINMLNALITLGDLRISHEPLRDTKDTTMDFAVECVIFSIEPINPSSVWLHYDVGGGWINVAMIQQKYLEFYSAVIPSQPAGTDIMYFITAENIFGLADTTSVNRFRVIDYNLIVSPQVTFESASAGETAWHLFQLTNDGIYADSFNLTLSGGIWDSDIWHYNQFMTITNPVNLLPDESIDFYVGVVVGASNNGDKDSTILTITSLSRPDISHQSTCITTSYGQALSLPFSESFGSSVLDINRWIYSPGVVVDSSGLNEPSEPYVAHFDGNPTGSDTLVSQVIYTTGASQLNLVYWYQQTGSGESPDNGNDLVIEYYDESGTWVEVNRHPGADPDMNEFEMASVPLPPGAYHNHFRIRFSNLGDFGYRDDWFIDDISLEYSPQAMLATGGNFNVTLGPGAEAVAYLYISNTGVGDLIYDLDVAPDLSQSESIVSRIIAGQAEPASHNYPIELFDPPNVKESGDDFQGSELLYNLGGPDLFGYIWVDSDDPSGPQFGWDEIASTGNPVNGLADDNFVGPLPVGFDFPFYGEVYGEFYVSSNGFIGFGTTDGFSSLNNRPIPDIAEPDNIIALLWDDLNFSDPSNPPGEVYYETTDNRLIVQFSGVAEYGAEPGDTVKAQMIIYPDGRIYLRYLSFGPGFDTEHCTVGTENSAGLDGLEIVYNAAYLKDSLCVAVSPNTVRWLSLSRNGGIVPEGGTDTVVVTFNSTDIYPGTYGARLDVYSNDPDEVDRLQTFSAVLEVTPSFIEGDANSDGSLDVADAVFLINYIFNEGAAPDPPESGEVNCDGVVNSGDVVLLIDYIFRYGPGPCIKAK